jgi:hypothetical protein
MTPGDRVAQLYPQAPISIAFYDMNGLQWDYSLISATTRDLEMYMAVNTAVTVGSCSQISWVIHRSSLKDNSGEESQG